jgi:hypothetical protein
LATTKWLLFCSKTALILGYEAMMARLPQTWREPVDMKKS